MDVTLVVNVEHGWDNVVGIVRQDAPDYSREELEKQFPRSSGYVIIDWKELHDNLSDLLEYLDQ